MSLSIRCTRPLLAAALAFGVWGTGSQAATISGTNITGVITAEDLQGGLLYHGAQQVYDQGLTTPGAMGTFLAVNDGSDQSAWPMYGPDSLPAGGGARFTANYVVWSSMAPQTTTGSGTAANP